MSYHNKNAAQNCILLVAINKYFEHLVDFRIIRNIVKCEFRYLCCEIRGSRDGNAKYMVMLSLSLPEISSCDYTDIEAKSNGFQLEGEGL